jgi:hypothetical protein
MNFDMTMMKEMMSLMEDVARSDRFDTVRSGFKYTRL